MIINLRLSKALRDKHEYHLFSHIAGICLAIDGVLFLVNLSFTDNPSRDTIWQHHITMPADRKSIVFNLGDCANYLYCDDLNIRNLILYPKYIRYLM